MAPGLDEYRAAQLVLRENVNRELIASGKHRSLRYSNNVERAIRGLPDEFSPEEVMSLDAGIAWRLMRDVDDLHPQAGTGSSTDWNSESLLAGCGGDAAARSGSNV